LLDQKVAVQVTSVDAEENIRAYVRPTIAAHGRYFQHIILGVSFSIVGHVQLIRRMSIGNEELRMIEGCFLKAHSLVGQRFKESHQIGLLDII